MSREFLKWNHRIQNRLLLSYFILILLITAFLGAIAYRVSEKVIEGDLTVSRQAVLQQISRSITNILDEINSMCYLYSSDNDLMTIMRTPPEKDRFSSYQQETEIMQILSRYQNTFGSIDIPHYVLLYAYNGNRYSSWITNRYNFSSLPERPWFQNIVRNNGKITWISTFNDKPGYGEDISVFSAAVEVKHYMTNQPLGVIMLNIYEDVLYANYKDAIMERGLMYIVDANGQIVSHPDKSQLGQNRSGEAYMQNILRNNSGSGKLITGHGGTDLFVSYASIPKTGWMLVEEVPMAVVLEPLWKTRNLIVMILAVCLLAGLLFAYLIARNISRPIKLLATDMRKVKNGDFTIISSIRSRNEIGELSHIFNRMTGNIRGLMEGVRREEELKRKAEMNVLQAQIGPHFLYNTLNSIRCMMGFGQVEKAQRMTVAFMRLIRKIFENKQEWITVRQEIEHIQDYIAIMQLRYDSSFEMNFQLQEEALDGKMIKLILQPLVENAIFHGLEPKRGGGTIRIEVGKEARDLVLTVSDDGVGMTEEQLENIWSPQRRSSPNGFNNIGIVNIQERVRLHFGSKYGLSIASRFGEGARVTVRMPYMEEGALPDVDRIDRG